MSAEGSGWYLNLGDPGIGEVFAAFSKKGNIENEKGWIGIPSPYNIREHEGWSPGDIYTIAFQFQPAGEAIPLSMRLGVIDDSHVVYLNGKVISSVGHLNNEKPVGYDRVRIVDLPANVVRYNEPNLLVIKGIGYFDDSAGIIADKTEIGPSGKIYGRFYFEEVESLFFIAIYAATGMYFAFLFLKRRDQKEYLMYSLFTASLVTYLLLRTQVKYLTGFDFLTMKRIEYIVLLLQMPLFSEFARLIFSPPENSRFFSIFDRFRLLAHTVLISLDIYIAFFGDARRWSDLNQGIVQPFWIFYIVYIFSLVINKLIKRDRDSYWFLLGITILVSGVINDILVDRHIVDIPPLTQFAFFFFIISLAGILANRFVRLHEQIEDLNKNLEWRVEDRTRQLKKTLETVNALKVQQDGDYFLTSQLIKPLMGSFGVSDGVYVKILTRQKKTFKFRKWDGEIGGDISIVDSVNIGDRDVTVFLSADAMGKSMQGAGGALVLGTVFKSIVAGTKQSSRRQQMFPELWIKECFTDIQDVFESFDGTMMASGVIGALDGKTGNLFFINAEHPWTVLYREGKASFIERSVDFRKFGMPGLSGHVRVSTVSLQPGDTIICGSDGRDDVLLSTDSAGNRVINEDEELFLSHVEKGQGDPEKIVASISESGELTDDITLLVMQYMPAESEIPSDDRDAKEILRRYEAVHNSGDPRSALQILDDGLKKYPENHLLLKEHAAFCFRSKDYQSGLRSAEKAAVLMEPDPEFFYKMSYAYKRIRNVQKAALYGERCRAVDPDNIRNLVNLADIYRILSNNDRARKIFNIAYQINAEDGNVRKLAGLLSEGSS